MLGTKPLELLTTNRRDIIKMEKQEDHTPTLVIPSPGHPHWDDQFPECLALKNSGA